LVGPPSFAATVFEPATVVTLTVTPGGEFTVESSDPAFRFGGNLNSYITDLSTSSGVDRLGRYQEIGFRYLINGVRAASMRVYADRPAVLFSVKYLDAAPNVLRFPGLTTYPRDLFHLTFDGLFGGYRYDLLSSDSPWVFFDGQANTFILSPASHFDTANMSLRNIPGIEVGVNPAISDLPQDFQFDTILVIGKGVNPTFEAWGRALTDLGGKTRRPNDADRKLSRLG